MTLGNDDLRQQSVTGELETEIDKLLTQRQQFIDTHEMPYSYVDQLEKDKLDSLVINALTIHFQRMRSK